MSIIRLRFGMSRWSLFVFHFRFGRRNNYLTIDDDDDNHHPPPLANVVMRLRQLHVSRSWQG